MNARALNQIDRHIAEARAHIKLEKAIIHRLQDGGHSARNLARSKDLLQTFEQSLEMLLERRLAILKELRRPRAASSSKKPAAVRRAKG